MKHNGLGYDSVLIAASPVAGLPRLAEEINVGLSSVRDYGRRAKAKLLSLAFNLIISFKNRINI